MRLFTSIIRVKLMLLYIFSDRVDGLLSKIIIDINLIKTYRIYFSTRCCNLHYEKFADGTVECIEDEIPFEIPDTWEWSRFEYVTINRDSERKPVSSNARKNVAKIYDYYGASGVIDKIDDYLFDEKLLLIGEDGANLIARSKPIAFFAEGKYWVNNHAHCVDCINKDVLCFLCIYLNAIDLKPFVTGSAQPKLNQDNLNRIIVPIPSLNEQSRILKSIDSFILLTKDIENNDAELVETISLIKSRILDLAIRGKLVPQNPDDEPASVLLERIRAEKEELIKQGKIKRDKNESVIFKGEDNSYYQDIPDSWEMVTLGMLTNDQLLNDGDWILSENMCEISDIKLIQLGSVGNMEYIDKGFKYIPEDTFNELKCTEIFPNYLLINRIISDRMNVCRVPEIKGRLITTVDTCWIATSNNYNSDYLMYALSSSAFQKIVNHYSRGTTRKRISKGNLIRVAIPFPPISEQERIVETIQKLFSVLDSI